MNSNSKWVSIHYIYCILCKYIYKFFFLTSVLDTCVSQLGRRHQNPDPDRTDGSDGRPRELLDGGVRASRATRGRHPGCSGNAALSAPPAGVQERLPGRGGPHADPDGRLGLHHGVGAERAVGRVLAEHVQAAELLLPHLRPHRHPGEELPGKLPLRWVQRRALIGPYRLKGSQRIVQRFCSHCRRRAASLRAAV